MKVVLSGGPKGGSVTDWDNKAPDADVRVFDTAEGPAEYRLDFASGQATFAGIQAPPAPTSFVSKVGV